MIRNIIKSVFLKKELTISLEQLWSETAEATDMLNDLISLEGIAATSPVIARQAHHLPRDFASPLLLGKEQEAGMEIYAIYDTY